MNTRLKNTLYASALSLLSIIGGTTQASAQEAALLYATNVSATNSLNEIDTKITPQRLASDFSLELIAEINDRLKNEYSELSESLRIKREFQHSILEDLDVRLKLEMDSLSAGLSD